MDPEMKLKMTLGEHTDEAGVEAVVVPSLTLEGNATGIRYVIGVLETLLDASTEGQDHTHLLHEDQPGVSLDPANMFVTLRRLD